MNKYKTLNLIRKIPLIPFVIVWRILMFAMLPLLVVISFFMTNWEDEWERDYYIRQYKNVISFGFWK